MRVLFIHNKYLQEGGEDVTVELEAKLLREKGHEVSMLIFENTKPSGIFDKLSAATSSIYNLASFRKVTETIEDFKPDVIHIHNLFFQASPSVLYAAFRKKIPVVYTLQNFRLICANALLLRDGHVCELCVRKIFPLSGIRYKCYHNSATQSAVVTSISSIHKVLGTWRNKVNRFIVPAEFGKSRFVKSALRVPDYKLFVKPNFIPDPGAGVPDREDFFLFVGRLSAEKGIKTLIDAFKSPNSARLVLIGDGPEKKVAESGFAGSDRVTFMGNMNKEGVLAYMKRCKALIFPSIWYEGLPFVVVEALATGTPVIASRLGSMVELVIDGYNGFHFEPGNSQDLHTKIELFLQLNEKDRTHMHSNAREAYLTKYHPEIHYQSIMCLYEQVIAEKSFPDV